MPVQGIDGRKRGVVILNYLGGILLEELERAAASGTGRVMLLNAEGYWAKGLSPEDEWGFMYPDRQERTMALRHPAAWERITAADQGQFPHPTGLYTFTTVRPLGYGMRGISHAPRPTPGPPPEVAASPDPAQLLRASSRWRAIALSKPSVSTVLPSARKTSSVRSSGKP